MNFEFFPSRTITLYMARLFVVRIIAVLAMLVLILQTLDLLGESGKVLAYPGNGDAELWTYVSLRAPQIIARFLPFSVLLATIITLATLNQNSEVIAMKASGLSAHQVLAPLLLAALIVAGISFAFNERIVARATATLSAWEAAEFGPIPQNASGRSNVWLRDGGNILRAASVSGAGNNLVLQDVIYYHRDPKGALFRITRADKAMAANPGWTLQSATAFDIGTLKRTPVGDVVLAKAVGADQVLLANVDPDGQSMASLYGSIQAMKAAGKRTAELEANLWHKISGPLSALLMPLLGAVAAFGLARSGQLFLRAVLGMGLGFAYFVVDNFALAMGNLGAYPPLLAAWSPFVLFLFIGETVLVRTEE